MRSAHADDQRAVIIVRQPQGGYLGGADPRREGKVSGFDATHKILPAWLYDLAV